VSTDYTSSIGNELFAINKFNINVLGGKNFSKDIGITASLNLIYSDDEGKDYYDPDNFFVKDHVKYDEIVADNGFNNHQRDIISSIRLTQGGDITFGIDFADINEGLGTMRHGSWFYLNNDSVDNRWHTRRTSAFVIYKIQVNPKFTISPKLYYRNDQTVNNSGYALTYGSTNGVFRGFKQQNFRHGIDIKVDYDPLSNLLLTGGVVVEDSQSANEAMRIGGNMSNYNNIINLEEEKPYDTFEFILDSDGNIIDTVFVADTLLYQNNIPIVYLRQYSPYFQIIYDMNKNWKLVAGGRYYKESQLNGVFTPRVGIVYNQNNFFASTDHIVFKLLFGQAFKALANDEKYIEGQLLENLKPAKSSSYELSITYLYNRNAKFEVIGWFNDIDNLYVYGTACMEDNINQITYGTQSMAKIKLGDFVIGANYTYTDGRNIGQWYQNASYAVPDSTPYEKLIRVSKHKWNASVNYDFREKISISIRMRYLGDRNADPINLKYGKNNGFYVPRNFNGTFVYPEDDYYWHGNGIMSGFLLFDLNIGNHDLGVLASSLKGLSVFVRITNLFNAEYLETPITNNRTSAPYNPQPGRRFTLRIGYNLPL